VTAPEQSFPEEAYRVPETAEAADLQPSVESFSVLEEDASGAFVEEVKQFSETTGETEVSEEFSVENLLEAEEPETDDSVDSYDSGEYEASENREQDDREEFSAPEMIFERTGVYEENSFGRYSVTSEIFDLVPDPGSAQEMAANSLTFLSTFGPTLRRSGDPGDAMVSEEDNTTEETASAVLRGQVLQNVRDLPFET